MLSKGALGFGLAAIVGVAGVGLVGYRDQPQPCPTASFRVPKGRWGFFIVPKTKEAKPGAVTINVPMDGRCEVPLGACYTQGPATFDDGTPIPYTFNANPPLKPNVVGIDSVQTLHPDGHLWFVGTEEQYRANAANLPIGLKKS
ncbi:hypothetical protein EON79_07935 [bacterium]|nr:MAG: hypothetical protein EON79_07935 [bacterium]